MDRNLYKDDFIRDISIEEFDHITDGVADHVFSDEYLAGKESIMRKENGTKISKLGIIRQALGQRKQEECREPRRVLCRRRQER